MWLLCGLTEAQVKTDKVRDVAMVVVLMVVINYDGGTWMRSMYVRSEL